MFMCRFREKRYRATLAACSLVSDLAILEDGDGTEIGEKVSYSHCPLTFPFADSDVFRESICQVISLATFSSLYLADHYLTF